MKYPECVHLNQRTARCFASLAIAVTLLGACSRNQEPAPVAAEDVPATVESAFKEANSETKSSAEEVVNALQSKDDPKAFIQLQELSTRPDLTPEQRSAASRSMHALNEKLRSAAAQGDQNAAEALRVYRSSK